MGAARGSLSPGRRVERLGALLIAEAGWTGSGKFAVGAWRYTEKQDDIRDLDPAGDPARSDAQGVYLLAEHPLDVRTEGPRRAVAFARLAFRTATPPTFPGVGRPGY
ncbi:hypothetical protein [Caulobacter sp. DWR1-3-2b1]|uniref:hypothetical protein n=1 Tax=Caulobacter sp. DWR1-3-2b1 TaxID=2804670 RepID=UPI003CF1AD80